MKKAIIVLAISGFSLCWGNNHEIDTLIEMSHEYLTAEMEKVKSKYRLNEYERFDWDLDNQSLVFSDSGIPKVIAKIQFVGSFSNRSNTWLWSWGNSTINSKAKAKINRVREYGKSHNLAKLIKAKWAAEEVDGWEMTSITAKILQAKGAYCAPDENGAAFVIFEDIYWAPKVNLNK